MSQAARHRAMARSRLIQPHFKERRSLQLVAADANHSHTRSPQKMSAALSWAHPSHFSLHSVRCGFRQRVLRRYPQRMFTARAARSATVANEIKACTIIRPFAQRDKTGESVGENAVLVLKARNR